MTIVLRKNKSAKNVKKAIEKLSGKRKSFNAGKHSGKLKRNLDGLRYQKKQRDEWK